MVSHGRNVDLRRQLASEPARQPRYHAKGPPFRRKGLSVWKNSEIADEERDFHNRILLERLEAENAQLRGRVVELVLQVQALRGATITSTA
jgi:hypothetical protein